MGISYRRLMSDRTRRLPTVDCGLWTTCDVEEHDDEPCNSNHGIPIAVSRRIHRGIRHRLDERLFPPSHVGEGGILVGVRGRRGWTLVVVVVVVAPARRVVLHVRADAGWDRRFRHAADDDPGEGS